MAEKKNKEKIRDALWVHTFWKKIASTSAAELGFSAGKFTEMAVYFLITQSPSLLKLAKAREGWAEFEEEIIQRFRDFPDQEPQEGDHRGPEGEGIQGRSQ